MSNLIPNLIPKNAKPINEKAFAYGEVTGHSHSLIGVVGKDFQIYELDGIRFCELKKDVELKHEEHDSQILTKSMFAQGIEIRIVREYDHFLEESRKVLD